MQFHAKTSDGMPNSSMVPSLAPQPALPGLRASFLPSEETHPNPHAESIGGPPQLTCPWVEVVVDWWYESIFGWLVILYLKSPFGEISKNSLTVSFHNSNCRIIQVLTLFFLVSCALLALATFSDLICFSKTLALPFTRIQAHYVT